MRALSFCGAIARNCEFFAITGHSAIAVTPQLRRNSTAVEYMGCHQNIRFNWRNSDHLKNLVRTMISEANWRNRWPFPTMGYNRFLSVPHRIVRPGLLVSYRKSSRLCLWLFFHLLRSLMEESENAIENSLFGFRTQRYGAAHPKFHLCILNQFYFTINALLRTTNSVTIFQG